jgi:hypothetical protein
VDSRSSDGVGLVLVDDVPADDVLAPRSDEPPQETRSRHSAARAATRRVGRTWTRLVTPASWQSAPERGVAAPGRRLYGRDMAAEGRTEPERDPDGGATGLVGRSIEEFVAQLRAFTDRARAVAGSVPGRLPLPALPSPPGALSAAQLRSIAQTVSAQRQSIAAMRSQLDAFDQQLAVFERILDPLVEWSSTWARLEEAVGDLVRRDGGDPRNDTDAGAP